MRKGTKTAAAVKLATKKRGITRVDFMKLGFSDKGISRTTDQYFTVSGTRKVNGRNYVVFVYKVNK